MAARRKLNGQMTNLGHYTGSQPEGASAPEDDPWEDQGFDPDEEEGEELEDIYDQSDEDE